MSQAVRKAAEAPRIVHASRPWKSTGPIMYLTHCCMNREPLKSITVQEQSKTFRQMAVDTTGLHFSLSIEFQGRPCLFTVGTISFTVWGPIAIIPECSRIIFQLRGPHQDSCHPHIETSAEVQEKGSEPCMFLEGVKNCLSQSQSMQ